MRGNQNNWVSHSLAFLIAAASIQPVFASVPDFDPKGCDGLKADASDIRELVKKTLLPYTFSLNRPIELFHYGKNPRPAQPIVDPKDKELADLFFYDKKSGASFFNQDSSYALYTASNPVISVDYGDEHPDLLLKLVIPAGVVALREKNIDLDIESVNQLRCFVLQEATDKVAQIDQYRNLDLNGGRLRFSYSGLRSASRKTSQLLNEIFKDLHIQILIGNFRKNIYSECTGRSPEIQMIDPELSNRIEKTIYSSQFEKRPSAEKLKKYASLLRYFEAVDGVVLETLQYNNQQSFWAHYNNWAAAVYGLPAETDFKTLREKQHVKFERSNQSLVEKLFSCSADPEFSNESSDSEPR